MGTEERNKRREQLMALPMNVLIELVIKLEEENKETRDLRKRLQQIRNIATDPGERNPVGRPRKEAV